MGHDLVRNINTNFHWDWDFSFMFNYNILFPSTEGRFISLTIPKNKFILQNLANMQKKKFGYKIFILVSNFHVEVSSQGPPKTNYTKDISFPLRFLLFIFVILFWQSFKSEIIIYAKCVWLYYMTQIINI